MEWRKILFVDEDSWEKQYDVFSDDGIHELGRLVYSTEYGWQSIIKGEVECLDDAETLDDAKKSFKEKLQFVNNDL